VKWLRNKKSNVDNRKNEEHETSSHFRTDGRKNLRNKFEMNCKNQNTRKL